MSRKNVKRLAPGDNLAEKPDVELAPTDIGSPMSVPIIVEQLVALQRTRQFCIRSQSRCDRSIEALIARELGYVAPTPAAKAEVAHNAGAEELARKRRQS